MDKLFPDQFQDPRFEIRDSLVPDAGLGIFSKTEFSPKDIILEYVGDIVPTKNRDADKSYQFELNDEFTIDAKREPRCIASQINDIFCTAFVPNVAFNKDGKRAYIKVISPIHPGDELYILYGPYYWGRFLMRHPEFIINKQHIINMIFSCEHTILMYALSSRNYICIAAFFMKYHRIDMDSSIDVEEINNMQYEIFSSDALSVKGIFSEEEDNRFSLQLSSLGYKKLGLFSNTNIKKETEILDVTSMGYGCYIPNETDEPRSLSSYIEDIFCSSRIPNVKFVYNEDKLKVITLRDIKENEELFVSFGESYWETLFDKNPSLTISDVCLSNMRTALLNFSDKTDDPNFAYITKELQTYISIAERHIERIH